MHFKCSIFVLVSLFVISSCKSKSESKSETSLKTSKGNTVSFIEGYIVKPSVLKQSISVSGTIKPFEETVLMPDVSGRVVSINFQEGMPVKKGALLIQLFNDDLQAQLHKLQAQLDIADQTEKRESELIKVNGISKQDYDQAVLLVHSVKADIEVVQAQLRKTMVLAPFDGVIGLRNISLGAVVTPGTALTTIRQVNQLKLEFSFPGKYNTDIKKGSKLSFSVQGSDKKFNAIVLATEEGIELSTRNLEAKAIIISTDPILVPGMYANVELNLKENNKALMVPTQAIIPQERNKKLIVCKGGKANIIVVKTGVRQATSIEVQSGIEPGDTVVTTGILFIKPGSSLKFSKVN